MIGFKAVIVQRRAIMAKIGSRYLEGLVISQWDSREIGNSNEDYVIKRLVVSATKAGRVDLAHDDMELVANVEVEVFAIEDGKDEGYFDTPAEVYRMPFPYDVYLRKQILRLMGNQPKMFVI